MALSFANVADKAVEKHVAKKKKKRSTCKCPGTYPMAYIVHAPELAIVYRRVDTSHQKSDYTKAQTLINSLSGT